MVIVSQDKEMIVNFDNISNIYVCADVVEGSFSLEAVGEMTETIGIYTTEERAKEVLADIILHIEASELCKYDVSVKDGYNFGDYTPIYQMPEE